MQDITDFKQNKAKLIMKIVVIGGADINFLAKYCLNNSYFIWNNLHHKWRKDASTNLYSTAPNWPQILLPQKF